MMLLLAADGRATYRGIDHTVVALAAGVGFERHDLIIVRAALRSRAITLIITPRRIWHRPEMRVQLLALRRLARNVGCRALLVPDAQLRKQPRLSNAEIIVAAAYTKLTLSQRFRVEILVQSQEGSATIAECAEMLGDHDDAFAAVLSLVHARRLQVSLSVPITAASTVAAVSNPTSGRSRT